MSIVTYADKCIDVSSWAAFSPEGSKQVHLEGWEYKQATFEITEWNT